MGLRSDGTVVAVGDNYQGQCNVGSWTGIMQVAAGDGHTVGLRSDGTVLAVGSGGYGECNVGSWTAITQVAAGLWHTVGLRSDGTVVAVGYNYYGQCNVGSWTGIMQVAAGGWHTMGLRYGGTVVAVGNNDGGQCDVSSWTGIMQVEAGSWDNVGLRSDGTVLAVGLCYFGECNVSSWNLLIQPLLANSFGFPLDQPWAKGRSFGKWYDDYRGYHLGRDMLKEQEAPVFSPADGIVRHNLKKSGYGYVVIIEHQLLDGNVVCSVLGHLKEHGRAEVNSIVRKGQVVGYLSNLPEENGGVIHLHFGLRKDPYSTQPDSDGQWRYRGYGPAYIVDSWYPPLEFMEYYNVQKEVPQPKMEVKVMSPVDLIVIDPGGVTIAKDVGEVPGMFYTELDADENGKFEDSVIVWERQVGDYVIEVVPEPNASPMDTYTLVVSTGGTAIVIAQDQPIGEIPKQPYVVQSAESEINVAPIADANGPYIGAKGVSIAFDASDSYDPDGAIESYSWDFGDGSSSSDASVTHSYIASGVYNAVLTVTDDVGAQGSDSVLVVVYDPSGGFVTGGGWINSPAGAYTPDISLSGKATFGFVSKYQKGASVPTGNTQFQFHAASMDFKSTSYQWLVISGARAQYKGSGTIDGTGDYGFILTAIDGQINGGGGVDKFRIKIWDKTKMTDNIVYDNQMGVADTANPTTTISGGSIVIHK